MSRKVAIVEDDTAIRENYLSAFRRYGYECDGYADRPSAQHAFAGRLPDLVIIDIGLGTEPEGGFELCRELRGRSRSLPIIFLTARDSDLDVISGLRLGADDYLTKDISLQHLLARVVALFRRIEALRSPDPDASLVAQGELTLALESMTVTWKSQTVPLTVTEFWMVHTLARYPGHVKSRDQLMDDANVVVDASTITSHIKRIRKKFVAVDPDFDWIDTVHGAGYRWRASPA
ncbi:MAG: proteobacterial dedicated sortase system response regulator [Pseudomonadota bacterium]